MGRTVELDERTLGWARTQFADYYARTPIEPPPRFARREFAAFPFAATTMMRRHAAFRTAPEFREFLKREVPRHVYYSSAYYRAPDHPTMVEKEWLGADLIFDLDADHLRQAAGRSYAEQLELVKGKVQQLLDDFLWGDLGADPAQTTLVFSGGRGYHVHLRQEDFLPLTSPERREIVDYVLGIGYDPSVAVQERGARSEAAAPADPGVTEENAGREASRPGRVRKFKRLYPPDEPGWNGRVTRSLLALLDRWEAAGRQATAVELESLGLPHGRATRLAKLLVDEGRGRQIREGLTLEVFEGPAPLDFLEVVLRQAAVEVQGETDAPVTTDVHRLIRLPGSLHGGSGLKVTPLTREELDAFDPLTDALPNFATERSTRVEVTEGFAHPFGGAEVAGSVGQVVELPTPQALFLALRGEARLPP